jgi:hypothetical protein
MASSEDNARPFSDQLEAWLKGKRPKTLASLDEVFGDKSFAISFLLLMILPALPLPTGGVTHVFEVIVILLCLELLVGRQTPWLPEKWKHMSLGKTLTGRVIPTILKWIRWLERRSSPRWSRFFTLPLVPRLLGLVVLIFTLGALLAPPFSGLDTLPSLGVVVVALAIILEDVIMLVAGVIIGTVGIGLTVVLGAALAESIKHFL